jgi:hypothetical protein
MKDHKKPRTWMDSLDKHIRRNRSTTNQIVCIRQILEKSGSTMRQYISYS